MATPAEVVADAFATAESWAAAAQSELTTFTNALSAAIQVAPTLDVTFAPVDAPGASTVADYVPPEDYSSSTTGAIQAGVDAAMGAFPTSVATAIGTNLTTRIAGGTGLAPAVEDGIWDRARERELATRQANIDQVARDTESLGWGLPPGVLVDAVARETRAYHDASATLSRDVAIKQADLEQSNVQKAVDQAISFVDSMRKAFDQAISFEQMLADIRSKRAQVALDVFRAAVDKFNAEVSQDLKHWEVQMRQYEAIQNYTLQAGRINSEIVRGNMNANLDAAKTGAQVFAQLTAAAYGLINASASVSASASNSVGYSYSNDTLDAPPSVTAV